MLDRESFLRGDPQDAQLAYFSYRAIRWPSSGWFINDRRLWDSGRRDTHKDLLLTEHAKIRAKILPDGIFKRPSTERHRTPNFCPDRVVRHDNSS